MAEYSLSESIDKDRIFIVKRSELDSRLEPKFYTQKYIDNENRLKSSKYTVCHLLEVTDKISDGTHFTPNYKDEGIKFISVKDVRKSSINLNDTKFISEEEADKLDKRCKPQLNDVLLTKIGATFGFAATVESTERFQIFVSLALLRPNSKIIPHFLEIFLNTDLAYIQYDRVIKGAGVPDLHLEDIRKVKISLPPKEIQQEIVNRYHEALNNKQQKEKEARDLLNGIDDYLLNELGITLPQKQNNLQSRIFTTSFSEVTGSRFDPKPYESFTKQLRDAITKSQYMSVPLRSLITSSKAGDWGNEDSENFDNKYSRCIVIRATEFDNVYNLKLDNSRAKFRLIEKKKLEKLDIKPNDLLIEKSGGSPDQPVGRVALITKELFDANELCYSNFIHKISVDTEKINPEYLFYFLKTIHSIGLTESMQSQTNGIRNLIMSNYFKQQIVIPIDENGEIDMDKQISLAKEIKDLKQKANALEQKAASIIDEAKAEIEKLILG